MPVVIAIVILVVIIVILTRLNQKCSACERKIGLSKKHPGLSGVLCDACYAPYEALLSKCNESDEKASSDARAAAWSAVCYLLCAKRVSLDCEELGLRSWEVCRDHAIKLCDQGLSLCGDDDDGQRLLRAIKGEALAIVSPPAERRPLQGGFVPAREILHTVAIGARTVAIDELHEFVRSLDGYDWLTKS